MRMTPGHGAQTRSVIAGRDYREARPIPATFHGFKSKVEPLQQPARWRHDGRNSFRMSASLHLIGWSSVRNESKEGPGARPERSAIEDHDLVRDFVMVGSGPETPLQGDSPECINRPYPGGYYLGSVC
jgi:hypothetical protein